MLGEPTPHFPLYLVSALVVEAVALRVRRPLPLALAAGTGIGTVGLASEWAWTHVWMPLPWPAALAPEGVLAGLAMALAAACVGAWLGARLSEDRTPSLRPAGALAAAAIFALVGYGLLSTGNQGVRAIVTLTPATPAAPATAATDHAAPATTATDRAAAGATAPARAASATASPDRAAATAAADRAARATPSPDRSAPGATATDRAAPATAVATVRIYPPSGADDANWLTATSWQGGGLVVDRLVRVREGVYRSTRPLPLTGDWKTMIRLHRGRALTALPVYLPADPAIPVAGIPARASVDRAFGPERKLLQRERKSAAGWLWGAAYATVLAIALAFLFALAWGVHRVSLPGRDTSRPRFDRPRTAERRLSVPAPDRTST